MTTALEKQMLKMKAMGITISTTPAAGREADFQNRPLGIIQAEAERPGMAHDMDDSDPNGPRDSE